MIIWYWGEKFRGPCRIWLFFRVGSGSGQSQPGSATPRFRFVYCAPQGPWPQFVHRLRFQTISSNWIDTIDNRDVLQKFTCVLPWTYIDWSNLKANLHFEGILIVCFLHFARLLSFISTIGAREGGYYSGLRASFSDWYKKYIFKLIT